MIFTIKIKTLDTEKNILPPLREIPQAIFTYKLSI